MNVIFGGEITEIRGNPFDDSPELYDPFRGHFAEVEEKSRNSVDPCCWVHYPNFWIWDKDYRVVRVYNIPHVLNIGRADNFFKASLKLFREARRVARIDEGIARAAGRALASIFYNDLREIIRGSNEIRMIAQFFGIDEDMAYDSFFMGLGMTTISQIAHGVRVAAFLLDIFEVVTLGTPIALLLDAVCFFSTRSALSKQRCMNYAQLMSSAYEILMTNPDHVLDSNVFVTAIDERNFYAFFGQNAFRRNDGAWCDFCFIGDLRRAPRARDCCREEDIRELARRFNELIRNPQQ